MRTKVVLHLSLLSLLLIASCAKRPIPLKPIASNAYLVLQLEKANLYFSKADVLEMASKEEGQENLEANKIKLEEAYQTVKQANFDTVSVGLKLDASVTDTLIRDVFLLVYLTHYDLLKQGRVKILNKEKKEFEDGVYYKRYKTRFGQIGEGFYFPDGTEFYDHVITIGE